MRAKLVKESLDENQDLFDKTLNKLLKNREVITQEWVIKIQRIFSKLKKFKDYKNYEEAIEDYQNVWWLNIVETGWEPKSIRHTEYSEVDVPKDKDLNFLTDLADEMSGDALKQLGLPIEIMQA